MKKYTAPGLKLGGTSFLLHAGYVPAMRFAAERCEDVALLLMETGEKGELLATAEEIREIGRIVRGEGVSLHVHLPTEATFGTPENARAVVDKAVRAIERSAPLEPHTFVLHVDFPELRGKLLGKGGGRADCGQGNGPAGPGANGTPLCKGVTEEQFAQTAEALRQIAACLPLPEQLAIENLETFPTGFWDGWLEGTPYSRCLDIGHVWKDGGDPAPLLAAWLPRVRLIHLHGLRPREEGPQPVGKGVGVLPASTDAGGAASVSTAGSALPVSADVSGQAPLPGPAYGLLQPFWPCPRDHTSLRFMPPQCLDAVLHPLWDTGFAGVLNLEVFSFDDFVASHAAIMQSWERRG